jgi:hypothetical protein
MEAGAPAVSPSLGGGCATDGETARRHVIREERMRLLGRGTPWRVKPKGVCGVEQTREAEGGENRAEGEKP